MNRLKLMLPILCIPFAGWGQVPDQETKEYKPEISEAQREKIQAMKVGFITERLDLTPGEAQAFWPLYNELQKKKDKERKAWKQVQSGQVQPEEMSDKQLMEIMNMRFEGREREIALEKEYHQKFLKVLPVKKVAQLYEAEVEFKRELLHKLKERHMERKDKDRGMRKSYPGKE